MANVKITELAADTNPASTDVLPFVDVASDETKKVTIANLLENAGNGSAGAPAFSFDSDPDTGMLRSGVNTLGFATGGTQRLAIDSAGDATFAGDIETTTAAKGVILKSPNGTRYRLTVANDGTLSTSAV